MAALEGITVVSLEHAIAAPLASRHLADQERATVPGRLADIRDQVSTSVSFRY